MNKIYLFLFLFISSFSKAEIIEIQNVTFRKTKDSVTIYMDIYNNSNEIFYLIGKHLDYSFKIYKTVIDNNIAKIINIDRLIIPANSKINLMPLGIYLVVKDFKLEQNLPIYLLFQNNRQNLKVKLKIFN